MTDKCAAGFQKLKARLISPPILIFLDWSKPFYIEADACDYAISGTLSQKDDKTNILLPIGYYSSKLTDHENNYSPGEKECWAL